MKSYPEDLRFYLGLAEFYRGRPDRALLSRSGIEGRSVRGRICLVPRPRLLRAGGHRADARNAREDRQVERDAGSEGGGPPRKAASLGSGPARADQNPGMKTMLFESARVESSIVFDAPTSSFPSPKYLIWIVCFPGGHSIYRTRSRPEASATERVSARSTAANTLPRTLKATPFASSPFASFVWAAVLR